MPRRQRGVSVRAKLTLSYAAVIVLTGLLLLAVVWVFLLRYVPATEVPGIPTGPSRGDLIAAFGPPATWSMVLLVLVGLVGGWMLSGWMLAPLGRITTVARAAEKGILSQRVDLEGRQDEFRELADGFDRMLARIETQVAEQRRFAANASHELRTPLAISQTLLDVAANDPRGAAPETLERLRAVNRRAIQLTEALLTMSRAEQAAFVPEPVDLSLLAEEAAETLLPLAERRGVTVEVGGDVALAPGSPSLLLQLVTNLVHNAIVHNLAEGGTVRVQTSAGAGSVRVTVENSGAPLTPQLVATLTEPFRRGTERIHTGHDGVGLGLAIVASIVEAHRGTLTLRARAGGGLVAAVDLPALASA